MERVGQRIRKRRTEKGLTLPRLAELAGVAKGYLSELESDKAARPSANSLFKIANALGTSIADLLGEETRVETPLDVPESLRKFAEGAGLTDADVRMLAAIQYRGARPETESDWQYLFESIRRSVKREASRPVATLNPPRTWRSVHARQLMTETGMADPVKAMVLLANDLLDRGEQDCPPSNLRLLASLKGIIDIQKTAMIEAGRLVPTPEGLVIQVNEDNPEGRQNFTIAHEIGHTLLPTYSAQPVFRKDGTVGGFRPNNEEEYFCDIAASTLLFPRRWFLDKSQTAGPALESILNLAAEFCGSLEATALAWTQLNIWPVAIVFWEEMLKPAEMRQIRSGMFSDPSEFAPRLRVSRFFRSREFPYFLPRHKSADQDSVIQRAAESESAAGELPLEVNGRRVAVNCEAVSAPFRVNGEVHRRVVSLLSVK